MDSGVGAVCITSSPGLAIWMPDAARVHDDREDINYDQRRS